MAVKPFESRIQDLVYNVDVGIGLKLIKHGLYILGVLVVMLLYTVTQFKGLKEAEAMDYAQLGRNLMQTKSFITQCVRPASMWYLIENTPLHDPMIDRHPDILHPPVYPALLAAGFRAVNYNFNADAASYLYPPEQWVVVPIGHLATLLTGLLVFLLGVRLFDRRIALISASLFFLSNAVWADAVSGLGVSVATFFTTLTFYFAILSGSSRKPDMAVTGMRRFIFCVLSALACALAILTRYGMVVLVPAILLYYVFSVPRRRFLWGLLFVLIVSLCVLPWLVRNYYVSGGLLGLAPYAALSDSSMFPGDLLERTLAPTFKLGAIVGALKAKWMSGFANLYKNALPTLGDGILAGLFFATFFYRFVRNQVHLFRWCLLLALVLLLALAAFFGPATARLLHVLWPVVILYGTVFFFMLLDRLDFELRLINMGVLIVFILLCALPLIFSLLPPRVGIPYPPYFPPYINHICKLLLPTEMICSDMPWATAWYGRRNSLLLPSNINEFYEINDYTKRISGMYFTTITRDKPYVSELLTGSYKTWFPILEGRIPSDFPLTQGFPIGDMDQLFLTDRRRWEE
ncbi:MAG: hypothetical protein PHP44_03930 [Kiritimatiellae bacterium]|nr:hypothetical protein [Kiritimatiellia bacterium]